MFEEVQRKPRSASYDELAILSGARLIVVNPLEQPRPRLVQRCELQMS